MAGLVENAGHLQVGDVRAVAIDGYPHDLVNRQPVLGLKYTARCC